MRWTLDLRKPQLLDAWSQNDHFLDSWLQKEQFFDARTQKQSPKCSSTICSVTEKLFCKLIDRGVVYCTNTCHRRKIETRLPDKGRRSCARHLYTSQSSRRVCSLLSLKVTALSERGGRAEVTSTPLIDQHLFPCLITFSGVCSFSVQRTSFFRTRFCFVLSSNSRIDHNYTTGVQSVNLRKRYMVSTLKNNTNRV